MLPMRRMQIAAKAANPRSNLNPVPRVAQESPLVQGDDVVSDVGQRALAPSVPEGNIPPAQSDLRSR